MSRNVHKKNNTIASAARADYSQFIQPADTEVLDKLWARSFYVEQREKMIPKLSFIYKIDHYLEIIA